MIVPRGLDYFDFDVGVHCGELGRPGVYVVLIGGGHRRDHNGNGVFAGAASSAAGAVSSAAGCSAAGAAVWPQAQRAKYHDQSKHCDDLFH